MADFSGYLALDEVYDGPFCVLSAVANRRYRRLAFRVLDRNPTQQDVHAFLAEFQGQLRLRQLTVRGITTDGAPWYPRPLAALWPDARHQVCAFHILKEILQAVLHAVAKLRKELAACIPKQPRGRPDRQRCPQARRVARQKQRVADLFEHRHLFAQHHRTAAERELLTRLTRGLPPLRALRDLMDEVYRLFDRRCKTATALTRLGKLRRRLCRLKRLGRTLDKLKSPNLEKALVFLDDRLLPSTSNAVERGNRRFRKAQKSISSVRTKQHLEQRIALDMQREQRAKGQRRTLETLHQARSKRE